VLVGILCVYAMFLIALSNVALAVLLALGPLFIAMLLFESTRRFFSAWLAQLANYALITLLTVMVASLLLKIVQSYATQTAARGPNIVTVDTLDMILASVLVFLVLLQVMPIAAGLAGGVSLNSFGVVSRTSRNVARATGLAVPYSARRVAQTARLTGQFAMGAALISTYGYGQARVKVGNLAESWRNKHR
jgi:type IV secretory pathway VirB6-like protein